MSCATPAPLTEIEVSAAEQELGVTFPAEYRRYLLNVSAGGPLARLARSEGAGGGKETTLVGVRSWLSLSRTRIPTSTTMMRCMTACLAEKTFLVTSPSRSPAGRGMRREIISKSARPLARSRFRTTAVASRRCL